MKDRACDARTFGTRLATLSSAIERRNYSTVVIGRLPPVLPYFLIASPVRVLYQKPSGRRGSPGS